MLLIVQGDPVLGPIKGVQLKICGQRELGSLFCPGRIALLSPYRQDRLTAETLADSWSAAGKLPKDLSKLPSGEGWDHVQKAVATHASSKVPKVFYTAQPAELIVFGGEPIYKKINNTQLLYATNTDSWVFTDSADGQVYYLVTGRSAPRSKVGGAMDLRG